MPRTKSCSASRSLTAYSGPWLRCRPTCGSALVLREFEELSYKEIAAVTGVPIGTVMSRLWRARRALLDGVPE